MQDAAPQLSVILVTPDNYDTLRRTVSYLKQQTARAALEVIIVAPSLSDLKLDETDMAGFWGHAALETGSGTPISRSRATAIHAARAPLVVLGEDHSFPLPEWAEALIEAHRQPYAAVGVEMNNALPNSMWAWSEHILNFGQWMAHASPGPTQTLPGHNTSYKRDILLSYGDELEQVLHLEMFFHQSLLSKGYRLYLEPRAKTLHIGFANPFHILPHRFSRGRQYAAIRSAGWSPFRRLVYAVGSPLIPLVRLARVWGQIQRAGQAQRLIPRVLPPLLVSLVVDAAGEAVGYLAGAGKTRQTSDADEFHRERHVLPRDLEQLHG